jgi:tetratricopeptide (TPR) repeat protein
MRRDTLWATFAAVGVIVASSTGCASSTSWLGGSTGSSWFAKKPAGAPDTSIAKSEESSWVKWPSWAGGSSPEPKTEENDPTSLYTKTKTLTPDLYEVQAAAYERQSKYPEAIKQYQAGLKAHPDNVPLLMGMARAYDRAGRSDYAIESYKRVIKVDPKFAKVHNDMALCLARNNDLPAAVQSMEQAISLDPKSELYRNNMATMLVDMGQHEAALAQMKAVQPPAHANFNVGYLLQSRGQQELAARYLKQSLDHDPSLTRARTLLSKVERGAANPGTTLGDGQEAVAQVARAGSEAANRWKAQATAAGETMADYGRDTARQAYGDVEQRAGKVRARVGDMTNEVQANANNAVQQAASSVYGQVEQAEKSVYGKVNQVQANAYEKVQRAQQKVNQTFETYTPSSTRGGAAPSSLKAPIESVYGAEPEASAPAGDDESAVSFDPPN